MKMKIKRPKNLDEYISLTHGYGIENYACALKKHKIMGKDLILDAGCGPGHWSFAAAMLNKKIIGIDKNPYLLKYAHKYTKINEVNNSFFHEGYVESLPFKNKQFDVILCNSVLQYVDSEKTFSELSRVIKDEGILIMFCNTGIGCYIRGIFDALFALNFKYLLNRLKIIFYNTILTEMILGGSSKKETFSTFSSLKKIGKKYGFTGNIIDDEPKIDYYRGICKNGKYLGIRCSISIKYIKNRNSIKLLKHLNENTLNM